MNLSNDKKEIRAGMLVHLVRETSTCVVEYVSEDGVRVRRLGYNRRVQTVKPGRVVVGVQVGRFR